MLAKAKRQRNAFAAGSFLHSDRTSIDGRQPAFGAPPASLPFAMCSLCFSGIRVEP